MRVYKFIAIVSIIILSACSARVLKVDNWSSKNLDKQTSTQIIKSLTTLGNNSQKKVKAVTKINDDNSLSTQYIEDNEIIVSALYDVYCDGSYLGSTQDAEEAIIWLSGCSCGEVCTAEAYYDPGLEDTSEK